MHSSNCYSPTEFRITAAFPYRAYGPRYCFNKHGGITRSIFAFSVRSVQMDRHITLVSPPEGFWKLKHLMIFPLDPLLLGLSKQLDKIAILTTNYDLHLYQTDGQFLWKITHPYGLKDVPQAVEWRPDGNQSNKPL
jgi:hypothetical protein